jgi:hypothetical protein
MTNPPPGRTRLQLDEVFSARAGDLAVTPYPVLLLALAVGEKSAVLRLRRNQLQKEIVFDAGAPVDCRSNIATETLGRFLVAAGKLSQEDQHTSLSQATARGIPLDEVLVERKLISASELYRMLQQNLGRKLLEPFSWESGSWEISLDVPPVESPLRVKVPQLLVTGIMKVEAQETADAAVATAAGKYLALAAKPHFGADDFRPTKEQRAVLDAARRAVPFDELRGAAGIDPEDLNRILNALMLLGLVTVTDLPMAALEVVPEVRVEIVEEPERVAVPFMVEAPASLPVAEVATADEVMEAYLGHKRKDAFDLLGVAETDGLLHVKQAFVRIADRFLPTKFGEDAPDGIREKAQDVFLAAARAYGELSDDSRRVALIKHRERKRQEAAAPKPDSKKKMIDPEELCRNGRDLAVSGKYREALSYFEMAAECDAQNGTYAAEAVWCRFQLGITPASNALTTLRHALRRDPQSGATHLYLGRVLAVLGQKVEAAAYLDRAGKLMPDDERPAQALKSIR